MSSPSSVPAAAQAEAVVAVRDVHYAIGGREIFKGLDLTVRRGRITAIMGPSGGGKTTLLKLITGQIVQDQGSVRVFGQDVATLGRKALYALRQRLGLLFQNGALLTDMDVFDNVAFPVREHSDLPETLIRKLVLTKLQAVGLRGAAHLAPAELSGGMARRIALARAIVMDPEVLMYDEPFVGLDPISLGVILRLIKQITRRSVSRASWSRTMCTSSPRSPTTAICSSTGASPRPAHPSSCAPASPRRCTSS